MTILTSLTLWLLEHLAGMGIDWAANKHALVLAKKAETEAQAQRDGALHDASVLRDKTEQAVEKSHAETDDHVERVHAAADAGGLDVLRNESDEAQRAASAANGAMR